MTRGDEVVPPGPDEDAARRELFHSWLRLSSQFAAQWFGPDHPRLFDAVTDALPTLRAIVGPHSHDEAAMVAKILSDLWAYPPQAGVSLDVRGWLTTLLAEHGDHLDPERCFEATWTLAWLMFDTPDRRSLDDVMDDVAALSHTVEQRASLAQLRGIRALYDEDAAAARHLLTEAYAYHRLHSAPDERFIDVSFLAAACSALGEQTQAYEWCEAAFALSDAHGERFIRTYVTWTFALSAWRDGDQHRAYVLALDGLDAAAHVGDHHAAASCIEVLAWYAAAAVGEPSRAAVLLGVSEAFRRSRRLPEHAFGTAESHRVCADRVASLLGPQAYARAFARGEQMTLEDIAAWVAAAATADPDPGDDTSSFTPRQREIAELIAEGLTNKEIAQRLLIKARTVETHVERMFRKLGVVSRAQLAVRVTAQK